MERKTLIDRLKRESFDILVIGGGATGSGIALDAATRGLKVALVERDDFAAGTSSRSTKLLHGGVRYLEQAVKKFDRGQFTLVREALHERATLIRLAPHLAHPLPIVTPIYKRWEVPYFRIGLKLYDLLSGKKNLSPSRYLNAKQALKNFPMLKAKGLRGGVLYYDGQFDDARMNVSLAMTAFKLGAALSNHVEVLSLDKANDRVVGARVRDRIGGEEFDIRARVTVNATGPFVDSVRCMDDPSAASLLKVSSGIHIVLDKRFSPPGTGLLIPETEDGRLLFLLPWLGYTLVGTTDNPATVEANPKPSEQDIQYILRHLEKYFDVPVHRHDILSAWSGLRPLVGGGGDLSTAKLSRDHFIEASPSGLVTITGGKWTTYRKMAMDAVDEAVKQGGLKPSKPSQTENTPLVGTEGYDGILVQRLVQHYDIDIDVAHHLAGSYGSLALQVADLSSRGYRARLVPEHPYIEAEVIYALQKELAYSAVDILARRMRLAFLDIEAAKRALPQVVKLQAQILGWDEARCEEERVAFLDYLGY